MRRFIFSTIAIIGLLLCAPAFAQSAAPSVTPPAAQTPQPVIATQTITVPAPAATTPTKSATQQGTDAKVAGTTNTTTTPCATAMPCKPVSPCIWFVYGIIATVFIASLLAMALIRKALEGTKFSLSDALSEEVTITDPSDPTGKTTKTELVGSTSRVIALMGSIVIMMMFVGFGAFVLYYYGTVQAVPAATKDVISFLVAGLTMFAPYTVNQFSSIFANLGK